jgi:hypothetical protein
MSEKKLNDEEQKIIDSLLSDVQKKVEFNREALERVINVMTLNNVLVSLKELSEKMKEISKNDSTQSPVILHPDVSGEAYAIFTLGQSIFKVIDDTKRDNDLTQTIGGVNIDKIDALDLSNINIPYIIPRDVNKKGSNITVNILDIDNYRLEEAKKLAQFVCDDKEAIELVRSQMGGYRNGSIFKD